MKRSIIVEIIALFFVILFLYTGISKLFEFPVFREQLSDSPILAPVAPIITVLLPITEFVISILLFIPVWRIAGLYAATGLMIAFTLYVISILSFDKTLPCSCGGIIGSLSWQGHLIFNTSSIALGWIAIHWGRQLKKIGSKSKNTPALANSL